jgi:hypothetical protein
MEPSPSGTPQNLTETTPIARVKPGMAVVDSAGEQVGAVTAVQMPGTDVRPDLPAPDAELLMSTGYLRTDGGGLVAGDFYADGAQLRDVAGDVVTLTVRTEELRRAG